MDLKTLKSLRKTTTYSIKDNPWMWLYSKRNGSWIKTQNLNISLKKNISKDQAWKSIRVQHFTSSVKSDSSVLPINGASFCKQIWDLNEKHIKPSAHSGLNETHEHNMSASWKRSQIMLTFCLLFRGLCCRSLLHLSWRMITLGKTLETGQTNTNYTLFWVRFRFL